MRVLSAQNPLCATRFFFIILDLSEEWKHFYNRQGCNLTIATAGCGFRETIRCVEKKTACRQGYGAEKGNSRRGENHSGRAFSGETDVQVFLFKCVRRRRFVQRFLTVIVSRQKNRRFITNQKKPASPSVFVDKAVNQFITAAESTMGEEPSCKATD